MNIVMIGPFAFAPKATVSARAFPMAQALHRRGHQVTLLLAPYDNLAEAGKVADLDGVAIRNLPLARITPVTPLRAARKLAILTRRLHPDIVHIFKPVGYAALAGMILRSTSRLPIVTDTDDWEGTGGWTSVKPYPWHWRLFFDFQERWLPRHSRAVTTASRTLQTQVWGMGIAPERVFYVPNCPGATLLALRDRLTDEDGARIRVQLGLGQAPMAIYVGHITLGDDLDLALSAMSRVREQVHDARLIIVGSGDGLARLQALATDLGVAQQVVFVGWVDHQQIPAYLAAADVAVYPYRDTLINRAKCSIKILEYMAMGKAIVTHRVGQNVEYLEHHRSGILVEPGNQDGFVQGLVTCLSDREFARKLGAEAASRIEQSYNWAHRISDVERAYQLARTAAH